MTWIPMKERTPEKGGMYLVTVYQYGRLVTIVDMWSKVRSDWLCNLLPVVAWMPLPEPYHYGDEKSDEDNDA